MARLPYLSKLAYGRGAFLTSQETQDLSKLALKEQSEDLAKRMRVASNSILAVIGVTERREDSARRRPSHTNGSATKSTVEPLGDSVGDSIKQKFHYRKYLASHSIRSLYCRILVYGGSDGFSFVHYLQRDYRTLGSLRFLFTGQFSGTLGEIIACKSGFLLDNINYGIQRVVWAALSSKKWRDTIITISSAVTWIGMSGIYYLIRYNTIIQQLALVPESSGLISFFSLYPFGSIQPSGLGRSTMLGLVLVLVDEFRSLSTSRLFNTFMPHFSTNELPLRGVHFDQYPSPLRLFSKVDECYRYLKRSRSSSQESHQPPDVADGHTLYTQPPGIQQPTQDTSDPDSTHVHTLHPPDQPIHTNNEVVVPSGNDSRIISYRPKFIYGVSYFLSSIALIPFQAVILRYIAHDYLNVIGQPELTGLLMPILYFPWRSYRQSISYVSKIGICLVAEFVVNTVLL